MSTACVPASLEHIFEIKLTEVMTAGLVDAGGAHVEEGVAEVLDRAGRGGALILGPGLGKADKAIPFARELAVKAEVALVLDADGLNAHAGRLEPLRDREAPTVLTPHGGELARLLEISSDEVRAQRLETAREAARRSGSVVVLKGDDTLVVEADGRAGVSAGGSPGLATAGTGDVLSGVIGAFLARGLPPWKPPARRSSSTPRPAAGRRGGSTVPTASSLATSSTSFRARSRR